MLLASIVGLYAVVLGCGGYIAYYFHSLSNRLDGLEDKIQSTLASVSDSPSLLGELKDSMTEIVEDTLESLTPPSAFDHIAGAAVQYFQMKMMAGLEHLPPALTDMAEDIVDNV